MPAAPPPDGDFHVVTVFYGTDRKALATAGDYGSDRSRALAWGEAKVTVRARTWAPRSNGPGPSRYRTTNVKLSQQEEDPKQHFTLQSIKPDDAQLTKIKTSLPGTGPKKDALVFVHGYNTTFKDALFRAAQLAYDLKFDGPVFVYSWPSGGAVTSYVYDLEFSAAGAALLPQVSRDDCAADGRWQDSPRCAQHGKSAGDGRPRGHQPVSRSEILSHRPSRLRSA